MIVERSSLSKPINQKYCHSVQVREKKNRIIEDTMKINPIIYSLNAVQLLSFAITFLERSVTRKQSPLIFQHL